MKFKFNLIKPISQVTFTQDLAIQAMCIATGIKSYVLRQYTDNLKITNSIDGGISIRSHLHVVLISANGNCTVYNVANQYIPCSQFEWVEFLLDNGFICMKISNKKEPKEVLSTVESKED